VIVEGVVGVAHIVEAVKMLMYMFRPVCEPYVTIVPSNPIQCNA